MPKILLYLYRWTFRFASVSWRILPSRHLWHQWFSIRNHSSPDPYVPGKGSPPELMIYCSSLGEFESMTGVIRTLRERYPRMEIEATVFSPSAFPINAGRHQPASLFPLETQQGVEDFFRYRRPKLVLFSDNSVWPVFLEYLIAQDIPYAYTSLFVRLEPWSQRLFWNVVKNFLRNARWIATGHERGAESLRQLQVDRVEVVGLPRLAPILCAKKAMIEDDVISGYASTRTVLICGSTHPRDEAILQKLLETTADLHLIVAPHECTPGRIDGLKTRFPDSDLYPSETALSRRVVIVGQTGILKHLYALSPYAYVGGGFDRGIHSILEPAAHRCRIFFGPAYRRFPEALELIEHKAAYPVANARELKLKWNECRLHHSAPPDLTAFFEQHEGAVGRLVQLIEPCLK